VAFLQPAEQYLMHHPIVAMITGILLVGIVGALCVRFIGPLGFLDVPGGRKMHTSPIPRVGGIVFFTSLFVWYLLTGYSLPLSNLEWVALIATFVVGVMDDRFELRARWKASLGLAAALLLAWDSLGLNMINPSHLHVLFFSVPNWSFVRFPLLAALFWGIPQAFNLIDGANGLAIGYGIIVSLCLSATGIISPLFPVMLTALLFLNWPKPKLFLGDAGSLTLGLLLAILAHSTFNTTYPNGILWLFAYPIIDVLLVITIRAALGQNIFEGDRNHLHHHLFDWLGTRVYLKTPLLWALSAGCAGGSLLGGNWRVIPWASLTILLLLATLCFLTALKKSRVTQPTQA
jgi:UDP-GlcNAc:undecaprenyl-phosphate/decaprenyl-phosphate GlcNAc-1-phosphate transferase